MEEAGLERESGERRAMMEDVDRTDKIGECLGGVRGVWMMDNAD